MTFQASPYHDSIIRARDWRFADIQKSIDLEVLKYPDEKTKGAPNILIALGISCYTEYWGKLLLGISRDSSRKCYDGFLKHLGKSYTTNPYEKLLNDGYLFIMT